MAQNYKKNFGYAISTAYPKIYCPSEESASLSGGCLLLCPKLSAHYEFTGFSSGADDVDSRREGLAGAFHRSAFKVEHLL